MESVYLFEKNTYSRDYFWRISKVIILLCLLGIIPTSEGGTLSEISGSVRRNNFWSGRLKRTNRASKPCGCGRNGNQGRIVGGTIAPNHQHPWLAALVSIGKSGGVVPVCGASLINDRYVLTAGHCATGIDATKFKILLGSNQINGTDVESFDINSLLIHPRYNKVTLENDVALIKLSRSARFSERIRPICLVSWSGSFVGRMSSVAGWGTLGKGRAPVNRLRETKVRVLSNEECVRKYKESRVKISEGMICAAGPGKDSCAGDSGGPLVVKGQAAFTQIGIVSFGIECGLAAYPGVYTRVSRFVKWIKANTKDATYCAG